MESQQRHHEIEKLAGKYGIKLIAEKIEKSHFYEQAIKRGYSLFQGYYFSEPIIESTFEIPSVFRASQMLSQFQKEMTNIDTLVEFIEKDLSFSIKLLRLINSNSN